MNQWSIQEAIFARLSGYTPLAGRVGGRIYDAVPQNTEFPYVVIGEDDSTAYDDDVNLGADTDLTLHVWSRHEGRKEAKEILQLIYDALSRYPLAVTGAHTVLLDAEYQNTLLDPDGLTRHGVIRFRLLTTHS
ncbi:DUF3168 domain-containing protein [Bordetella genomosp. 7]|uniref:DUF3168 domain-containing protein n=1 Tax=Bordetella genomosp. 7 TaxID=1416805 RepID=A0A261QYR6_9BORD|nr:DUF3168 domain-containing protein [Bordetella genomosp. 7]OZI17928.1 hypothetical protein CAL19_12660 [Bordetella genomosp. 7]